MFFLTKWIQILSCILCDDGDDGDAGVYLYLCFHIVPGPSDDIWQRPFKHDVTLDMVDDEYDLDHCSHSTKYNCPISPNLNEAATKELGGYGQMKFTKLSQLLENITMC